MNLILGAACKVMSWGGGVFVGPGVKTLVMEDNQSAERPEANQLLS